MQSDDVVWGIINHQFCSYKIKAAPGGGHSHNKAVGQNFCKNEYNATGLCNKASCPLANSRYATVREIGGIVYLFQKTVERAHSPANLWEKTRLSTNYAKALEQIDSSLIYWPGSMIHRCKQRLTKITQYLIKIRRLKNKELPQLVAIKSKTERREKAREAKALSAARLTKTLEKELIGRLKSKTYGDAPLNVNEDVWRSVLEGEKRKELEQENELELEDEETDEDSDDDGDEEEEREFVSDLEESDLEDMEDWDDGLGTDDDDEAEVGSDASSQDGDAEGIDLNIDKGSSSKRKASQASSAPAQKKIKPTNAQDPKSKKKRKPRMEIEYEEEQEWLGTQV
ncbi:hypothetical protein MJO28_002699 [Puccinia striiformis f. sp. tritici]|uniref:Protein MAK16 n=3 Tax=Puccinia striiformis TaxID=27350 RepID=A0A2S4WGF7_9BASI|nr:hypothetical protein Pst134EA_005331 [Puccinia striiformis f. sp. tritici]POV96772.1 hypothetical protein PSTT_15461 [Puccinia striiformis]KAH9471431.1 hypothetical protein Pst134EA_005331 [Puccinia striiformis f. sp. tritici]KAI7958908.1 hypothetical protein MJO28_002699 [Puccinia striiformis f. sp. tritici]KAI7964671.1 hypothetical protein MJO29_002769 [Puccinia striiformis f. sp. tritici]POW20880.1 hypothetical protein PSHT_03064 [Puccinia striiformis]